MSDLSFVVRGDLFSMGWVVRTHSSMGEGAVGPRLAKGVRFPNEIGTSFENKSDALRASESWNDWYYSQPYNKKARKNMKYVA